MQHVGKTSTVNKAHEDRATETDSKRIVPRKAKSAISSKLSQYRNGSKSHSAYLPHEMTPSTSYDYVHNPGLAAYEYATHFHLRQKHRHPDEFDLAEQTSYSENFASKRLQFSCSECNRMFSKKFNYQRHVNNKYKARKGLACPVCGGLFSSPQSLQNHHRAVHSRSENTLCDICGSIIFNKTNLKRHKLRQQATKDTK